MSDLKKWKEEFARYEVELMNGAYVSNEMIYISACKAREKELQETKAQLEKAEIERNNLMLNFAGYQNFQRERKLEEENKTMREALEKIEEDAINDMTQNYSDKWYRLVRKTLERVRQTRE